MARFISISRYYAWYYPAVIGLVAALGIAATFYTYSAVSTSVKDSLLSHTTAVVYALAPYQVATFSGTPADRNNLDFIELRQRLIDVHSARDDIRFVYIVRYRDGEPYFSIDSEPEDSADYTLPGTVFDEAGPAFREPFIYNDAEPFMEDIYSDRWGTWLTAVVPIADPETGGGDCTHGHGYEC